MSASDFAAVFYPGGHRTKWDLPDTVTSNTLIEAFLKADQPVDAECHAPVELINVRGRGGEDKYLLKGKRVTGFSNAEEEAAGAALPHASNACLIAIPAALLDSTWSWTDRGIMTMSQPEKEKNMSSNKDVRKHRWWAWIIATVLTLILIVTALSYLIESDVLCRYVERQMNSRLKGYTVHVGRVFFHPFALDLGELALIQNANSDQPVARIGRIHASLHWRALLRAHLVGDVLIETPKLYINLANFRAEEKSPIPIKQKGWQEAVEAIYPLKINVLTVRNGEVTYVDQGPYKPLHITDVSLYASNIRNISVADHAYPSTVQMEARLFNTGRLKLNGNANFLQEPHLGIKANVELADMELGYFAPITNRGNISVKEGTLSANGALEYAPRITDVSLNSLDMQGVIIDYHHLLQTAATEQQRVDTATHTAKDLSNEPSAKIRVEVLRVKDSSFGYVNKTTNPAYRLFIDHLDVTLKHFSNQLVDGPATFDLKGEFMGTGDTRVTGSFRPETKSPHLTVNIAIENTQMRVMSDLFRAYGDFDIQSGLFSFYSELAIKDNRIEGYVKPLFMKMKVYDRRSVQQKGFLHKVYVDLISSLSKLLENKPRKEVATKVTISGTLESPDTSAWQGILNLIRNAFIAAILPEFEREVSQPETMK